MTISYVEGSDFSDANIQGAEIYMGLSKEQIYQTKNYKLNNEEYNLSGVRFFHYDDLNDAVSYDLSGVNFEGKILREASFGLNIFESSGLSFSVILTEANFKGADISSGYFQYLLCDSAVFDGAILKNSTYYDSDFSGSSFRNAIMTDASFSKMNFSESDFTDATLAGATFSETKIDGAVIKGADLSSIVQNGFTKEHLYSTASYKDKDLSGVWFDYNNISGWDLSGQNLQNASFFASRLTNTDMSGSDLRGAEMTAISGSPVYKNTIMSDGLIKNFSMTSTADSFSIRKYEPATEGGALISAKLDTSSTISGGAALALERGADFEIINNSTLTVAQGSVISINTDASSSTSFSIMAGSSLAFENGAILEINLEGTFTADDSVSFVVFDWENGGSFEVIGDFVKDESIFLSLNGEKFNGDWNYNIDNNKFIINISQVPEPAAYAAIFGALALFIGIRRGKRN